MKWTAIPDDLIEKGMQKFTGRRLVIVMLTLKRNINVKTGTFEAVHISTEEYRIAAHCSSGSGISNELRWLIDEAGVIDEDRTAGKRKAAKYLVNLEVFLGLKDRPLERINEGESGADEPEVPALATTTIGPGREAEIRNGDAVARIRNRSDVAGEFGCDPDGVAVLLGISHSAESLLQAKEIQEGITNLLVIPPVENCLQDLPNVTTQLVNCDPKIDNLREVLTPICLQPPVSEVPDDEILRSTLENLGVATAEDLIAQIRRKGAAFKSLGLLPKLACDARQVAEERAKRAIPRADAIAAPPFEREAESSGSPWSRIRARLKEGLPPQEYENWFAPTRFDSLAEGVLTVCVPDPVTAEFLKQEYGEQLLSAAAELEPKVRSFRYRVATEAKAARA